MEEDVDPKDEDGVDDRGVYGGDGWVCGLGVVDTSSIFGLVRGAGAFTTVLPTFRASDQSHRASPGSLPPQGPDKQSPPVRA